MSTAVDPQDVAFRPLSDAEWAEVRACGEERETHSGELLFEAGEASFALFVVLDGEIEIRSREGAVLVTIVSYQPGGFAGELNLLSGQRRSLSCRVVAPGRVLVISQEQFRRLMSGRPALAEPIFNALLARREVLRTGIGAEAIRIVGSRYSPAAMSLRSFAEHSHLAHAWIDVEESDDAEALLASLGLRAEDVPGVITATDTLRRPR